MEEILRDLIDAVRDLNKSISMHVGNHKSKAVDDMIISVAGGISNDLAAMTKKVEEMIK